MKKVVIIEDNYEHNGLIEQGVKLAKLNYEIVRINIDALIIEIKAKNSLSAIPDNIDLFIIDVSLEEGQDELGLKLLLRLLEKRKKIFKYIVTSIWDKAEFETAINIADENFINKSNFDGFELKLEFRNKIDRL